MIIFTSCSDVQRIFRAGGERLRRSPESALSTYGGTVLKSSLPKDVEEEIQAALDGARTAAV